VHEKVRECANATVVLRVQGQGYTMTEQSDNWRFSTQSIRDSCLASVQVLKPDGEASTNKNDRLGRPLMRR
jgi:hypothetical protein